MTQPTPLLGIKTRQPIQPDSESNIIKYYII